TSPASWAVVISMPRRRNPSATPASMFSSRWYRTTVGVLPLESIEQPGTRVGFHGLNEFFFLKNVPLDLVAVVPKVSQCCVHVGQGNVRIRVDDFIRSHALQFVADVDIL